MATHRDHFIAAIIDADLQAGRVPDGVVVTRFPPEPNGFLHIGHAKSICLNFGLAQRYSGRCFLRFDDTNPLKEESLYVESIERDVRWLGFEPAEGAPRFASDYFEQMYGFGVELIERGLAFVCSQSADELRRDRGTPYEPGVDSPDRDRPVAQSLDLFRRMKAGEFPDGIYTLRARIDMAHPNLVMRDPALYRIRHAHHHRQGDGWCIYPMYDFAHCIEDAIEGVTHSICTLEFESNRALYDWVLDNISAPSRPRQYEFARLSLDYTLMSKRKLLQLVADGHVSGWDDPRMPTIAGMRRRGVTPAALRAFAHMVGVAKNNSTVDIGKLEYCIRDDLNRTVPRRLGVIKPLAAVIDGLPGDELVYEGEGRTLQIGRRILVESEDYDEAPPDGWKRLSPGRQVRLRWGPVVRCEGMVEGELRCTFVPDADAAKGLGVIHWVDAQRSVPVQVRLYDRLFRVEAPSEVPGDLNPDSLEVCDEARVEPGELPERLQLERVGYFALDPDSTPERPVLNRIVTLKDGWTKVATADKRKRRGGTSDGPGGDGEAPRKELDDAGRHYVSEHGVSEEQALVLAADPELGALFGEVVEAGIAADVAAAWIAGDVRRHVKEAGGVGALKYDAASLVELLSGELTRAQVKEGLEALATTGALPEFESGGDLNALLDGLLAAKADELGRYRDGDKKLFGFFMGEAMRATKGAFDPGDVRATLQAKLDG